MAIATFGAGCFWGVEEAFRKLPGVTATAVGYSGGSTPKPSYEMVCTGRTGHAEVVRVDYDPDQVSYQDLLGLFWEVHDPTQINRQGPDIGSQYRSAIFTHDSEQQAAAGQSKAGAQASGRHRGAIVTEIAAAGEFHMAEDYHQQFFEKRARMARFQR